jgi:hypothetical protein
MTSVILHSKQELDELTRKMKAWISEFSNFENGVIEIQRRTARRLVCKHLDLLQHDISNQLKKATTQMSDREFLRDLAKILSAYIKAEPRPKARQFDLGAKVEITSEGVVSVPRSRFPCPDSIILTENEFNACIDEIKRLVNQDPIGISQAPAEMAKNYFARYCRKHATKT